MNYEIGIPNLRNFFLLSTITIVNTRGGTSMQAAGKTITPGTGIPLTLLPLSPSLGQGVSGSVIGEIIPGNTAAAVDPSSVPPGEHDSITLLPMTGPDASAASDTEGKTVSGNTTGSNASGGGDPSGIPPRKFTTVIGNALRRLGTFIWPPVHDPLQVGVNFDGFQYHGTSFGRLADIIHAGGAMAAGVTYFSDHPGFCFGYARSHARRSTPPGFVLQFSDDTLEGKTKPGHYHPHATDGRGPPQRLAFYTVATESIPLALQTEPSKQMILRWIAAQQAANPWNPAWSRLLEEFTAALQPTQYP